MWGRGDDVGNGVLYAYHTCVNCAKRRPPPPHAHVVEKMFEPSLDLFVVVVLLMLSRLQVDGTKEQPITIKGPSSGATAIVKGDDKSGTCVEINHDFYILDVRQMDYLEGAVYKLVIFLLLLCFWAVGDGIYIQFGSR